MVQSYRMYTMVSQMLMLFLVVCCLLRTHLISASATTGNKGSGVSYIRWGRTTCNGEAVSVYKGYAAGSHYSQQGGGTNYLCLPEDPQWSHHQDGFQGAAQLYGVEYQFATVGSPFSTRNIRGHQLLHNDAPCTACHVESRSSVLMIPARINCPTGWTMEYWGYLVSGNQGHPNQKTYECLDEAPEIVSGGSPSQNSAMFHFVEAVCGALHCPKYVNGWEMSCVVCTK